MRPVVPAVTCRPPAVMLLLAALSALPGAAPAQAGAPPVDEYVQLALSLLPAAARAGTAIVWQRTDGAAVHRPGSGPSACTVDTGRSGAVSLRCGHRTLDSLYRVERDLPSGGGGEPFAVQVCRELARAGQAVPAGAMEISASAPLTRDGARADSMPVYHLL